MSITKLQEGDLYSVMNGACFLGSGGGGGLDLAEPILNTLKDYLPIEMCDIPDVPADQYLATTAGVGAPTAGGTFDHSPMNSFKALETFSGRTLSYVIPGETGAANTLIPMLVTAKSGNTIRIINGDGAGRAMPQIEMSTFALADISTNPSAIANENDDTMEFSEEKAADLDAHLRCVVSYDDRFKGATILSSFITDGGKLNEPDVVVPDTIIIAKRVGEALQLGSKSERTAGIIKVMKDYDRQAFVLEEGYITKFTSRQEGGFDCGTAILKSTPGKTETPPYIEVNFVNENLVAWCFSPDTMHEFWGPGLLCYMSPGGAPYSNADIAKMWQGDPIPVVFMFIDPPGEIDNPQEQDYFKKLYYQFFYEAPKSRELEYTPVKTQLEMINKKFKI